MKRLSTSSLSSTPLYAFKSLRVSSTISIKNAPSCIVTAKRGISETAIVERPNSSATENFAPYPGTRRGFAFQSLDMARYPDEFRYSVDESFYKLNSDPGTILAEYVWIGGSGQDLRSKIRSVKRNPKGPEELPIWNYDGSSTGQAPGTDSEVTMVPRRIFKHPFHSIIEDPLIGKHQPSRSSSTTEHILVLCDTYDGHGNPLPTNSRFSSDKAHQDASHALPTYGFEQEYSLMERGAHLGWPVDGYPAPQGPYYCSVGVKNAFGRHVAESHAHACLYAGIHISGINAETLAGQWEYQVGPITGVDAADQLWMSRFILHRVGELFGLQVNFDPKPVPGDWNGAGCHVNFCVKDFHQEDGKGWVSIMDALVKLAAKHPEHIKVYGEGNERRLTGKHETQKIDRFTYGIANRYASVRIPRNTYQQKKGYIEDRRPASNMDPYLVSERLVRTVVLDK